MRRNWTSRTPFNYLGFLASSPANSHFQNIFLTLDFLGGFHLVNKPSAQRVTPHRSSDINSRVQVYSVAFRSARQPVENCNLSATICWLPDNWTSANQRSWRREMTCSNMSSVTVHRANNTDKRSRDTLMESGLFLKLCQG